MKTSLPRTFARVLICASVIGLLAAVNLAGSDAVAASAPTARSGSAAACRTATGPFHTVRDQMIDRLGHRYIPYGINVVPFARPLTNVWRAKRTAEAQIDAARTAWCANTVRLMVSQQQMVRGPEESPWIHRETLRALRDVVNYGVERGLVVTITLQTQRDTDDHLFMPSERSKVFWKQMARSFPQTSYPNVAFDLINEPGQVSTGCAGKPRTCTWRHWRDGFTYRDVRYYGMESIARIVRAAGARNLLWVEGITHGSSLARAGQFRLTRVGAVAYSIHRPTLPPGARTYAQMRAVWSASFGYLAEQHLAPVLDGEWTQYAVANRPWACSSHPSTFTHNWFRYLDSIDAGLVSTKLGKGVLIRSRTDYTLPTTIKSDWRCQNGLNQGAGRLIMDWYHQQNQPPPPKQVRFVGLASTRLRDGRYRVSARLVHSGVGVRNQGVRLQRYVDGRWASIAWRRTAALGAVSMVAAAKPAAPRVRLHVAAQHGYAAATGAVLRLR